MDGKHFVSLPQAINTVLFDSVQTVIYTNQKDENHISLQTTYKSSFTHPTNSNFDKNNILNQQNEDSDKTNTDEYGMLISIASPDYKSNNRTQYSEHNTSTKHCTQTYSYENKVEFKSYLEKLLSGDRKNKIFPETNITVEINNSRVQDGKKSDINFDSFKNITDKQAFSNSTDGLCKLHQKVLNSNSQPIFARSNESWMAQTKNNPELESNSDNVKNLELNQSYLLTDFKPEINVRARENDKMVYKEIPIAIHSPKSEHKRIKTVSSNLVNPLLEILYPISKNQVGKILNEKDNKNDLDNIHLSLEKMKNKNKEEDPPSNSVKPARNSEPAKSISIRQTRERMLSLLMMNKNKQENIFLNTSLVIHYLLKELGPSHSNLEANVHYLNEINKDPSLSIFVNTNIYITNEISFPDIINVQKNHFICQASRYCAIIEYINHIGKCPAVLHACGNESYKIITSNQKEILLSTSTNSIKEPEESNETHIKTVDCALTSSYLCSTFPQRMYMNIRDKTNFNKQYDSSSAKISLQENTQNIQELNVNVFSQGMVNLQKSANYENEFYDVLEFSKVKYFSQSSLPTFYQSKEDTIESDTDDTNEVSIHEELITSDSSERVESVPEICLLQSSVLNECDSTKVLVISSTSYTDDNQNSNLDISYSQSELDQSVCVQHHIKIDKELKECMMFTVSSNTFNKMICKNLHSDDKLEDDNYIYFIQQMPEAVTQVPLTNFKNDALTFFQVGNTCNKEKGKISSQVEKLNTVVNHFNVSEFTNLKHIIPARTIKKVPELIPGDTKNTLEQDKNILHLIENKINTTSKNGSNFETKFQPLYTGDQKSINERASKMKADILIRKYDQALNKYSSFTNSDSVPLLCSEDNISYFDLISSYPTDLECHNSHIKYMQYDATTLKSYHFSENKLNNIMNPLFADEKSYEAQRCLSDISGNSDKILENIIELEIDNSFKKSENLNLHQVKSKTIINATTQTDITGNFNICKHGTCSDYKYDEKHCSYTKYKRNIETLVPEPIIINKKARYDSCTNTNISKYVKNSNLINENASSDLDQKVPNDENDDSWKTDDMYQSELYANDQPITSTIFEWNNSSSVKKSSQETIKPTKHSLHIGLSKRAKPKPLHATAFLKK